MKGRKPIPTSLKKLRGNPGKRAYNDQEPKPDIIIPDPPATLGKVAKEEWARVTPMLLNLRMVSALDLATLLSYAQNFELFITSGEHLKKEGFIFKAPSGYPVQNPWLSIHRGAETAMLRAATDLGMNITQRSRLKVEPPKEKSKIEKFIEMQKR